MYHVEGLRAKIAEGLGTRCALMDARILQNEITALYSVKNLDGLLRPCTDTRVASDAVLVFPYITTLRGRVLFPFIPDNAHTLSAYPDPDERVLPSILPSQMPDGWWTADVQPTSSFAYFTSLGTSPGTTMTWSTQPSSGVAASTTVAIPPLASGSRAQSPGHGSVAGLSHV